MFGHLESSTHPQALGVWITSNPGVGDQRIYRGMGGSQPSWTGLRCGSSGNINLCWGFGFPKYIQ